jgi:Pilus formation protein N terminal region
MRSVIAFTVSVRQEARIAAALIIMATALPPARAADPINVILDQARITKMPDRTATIVVGNPLIADVSLHAGGVMVVTGKGYGATNLIVLDRTGQVLVEQLVRVRSPAESVVVYRGATVRESFSCAPYCEARLTLGDKSDRYPDSFFDGILRQALDRNRGAQQGEAVEPSGGGPGGAAPAR